MKSEKQAVLLRNVPQEQAKKARFSFASAGNACY
jgi:hypothetical protein